MKKYKLKNEMVAIQFDGSVEWQGFLLNTSREYTVKVLFGPDRVVIDEMECEFMDYVVIENGDLIVVGRDEFEQKHTISKD